MNFKIIYVALYINIAILIGMVVVQSNAKPVSVALTDNGCSKPALIEIEQGAYNNWPNNKGIM